jgi:methionine-S-sulfoxide reductase
MAGLVSRIAFMTRVHRAGIAMFMLMCAGFGCRPSTSNAPAGAAGNESVAPAAGSIAPAAVSSASTGASGGAGGAGSSQRAAAVFAGGCFWCVEAVFEELDGVIDAVSGYAGGSAETANYKDVCSGTTGHAEAVQIIYEPSKISYEQLLQVHFATHDPTTLNRQGNDVGPQYRSAIFFADEREKQLAAAMIADLTDARAYSSPIVTTLEPLKSFYPAETHHQNYVCQNPRQSYVQHVALPKVMKVRKTFSGMVKEQSPLGR